MASLYVESLFTNIYEKQIKIILNLAFFKNVETFNGLNRIKLEK